MHGVQMCMILTLRTVTYRYWAVAEVTLVTLTAKTWT
jgi:hypothetical protein